MTVNNVDVDLQKLLENTTLSSSDSFTKARRPQLKPSNESAAQHDYSSKQTAKSSIEDFPDWDIISNSESTAEGSGCTASHSRHSPGPDNKLTASNMKVHDLLSNEMCAINERIWMREDQAKHSVLAKGTLTRCSEVTIDLGESYCLGTASMPDSDFKDVGAWTFDTLEPPMA